jgi:peptide/nickel transport system substrate-binding protein
MRCIRGEFPKVLGYVPEFGSVDPLFASFMIERLVDWDDKGNTIGQLAESWEGDSKNKTLTWHLRSGVKFHDGTPFDAEALRWNFQLQIDTARLTDAPLIKSLEVVNEYTLRMHLTEYSTMAIENYGWSPQISPTAFKEHGGKEWARFHPVGTGPFKLGDFKRDTSIRYEKNENYWRKGYPLLDAIEIRFIPDPMTATMMMEQREADLWLEVLPTIKNAIDLEHKGLKVNWGPGGIWSLIPNSSNPKSPLNNKKVREALEYAIDRPSLAKALGYGRYEAVAQIVASGSKAYVQGYNPRPYNPEKARQLLAEAGFPNGFETKLLVLDLQRDTAVAVQGYLAAAGIKLDLDVADMGRYFASVFGPQGWSDLALVWAGINPDTSDVFVHWGPRPMDFRYGQILKSPEYLALCDKGLHTYDDAGAMKVLREIVRQAGEDAMIIPLVRSVQAAVMQPYVHSDYMKIHRQTMNVCYRDWLESRK